MRTLTGVLDSSPSLLQKLGFGDNNAIELLGSIDADHAVIYRHEAAVQLLAHTSRLCCPIAIQRLSLCSCSHMHRYRREKEKISDQQAAKVLCHALRTMQEAEQAMDEGRVTFPVREAEYIRRAKAGDMTVEEVLDHVNEELARIRGRMREQFGEQVRQFAEQ
jgi:hypothetical protein